MGRLGTKPILGTKDRKILEVLDHNVSKAFLGDLVIDLLRASHGAEIDGDELYGHLKEAIEPVAVFRGDRVKLP